MQFPLLTIKVIIEGLFDDLLKSIPDIQVDVLVDLSYSEFTGCCAKSLLYCESTLHTGLGIDELFKIRNGSWELLSFWLSNFQGIF